MDNEKKINTGTTTVGIVCKDGVVLATDTRATMGYFIASKDIQKIYPITDKIAMTVAGSVGDAQALVRLMKAELKLFKMENEKEPTVKAAATLLANILSSHKFFPYFVQLLVAGVDENGPALFSVDMVGGVTEEKMASTGSGSPIAYGVLEAQYLDDIKTEEGKRIAAKAVLAATKRDAASGEHIDVVVINKNGISKVERRELREVFVN